ncbi:hypothetical protein DBV14_04410 [Variovorax sp. KBW07]|uniref:hypothetical protein n=1 Tax=Variovorax sp. KBW07 TaxID=2153358 RepID=UPI000F58B5F4|nr:hypothetical protein [Variovorax sp. KBW07]RQO62322.1 hypothetical protein DBV14_04410 [Variovorax sp. KBW07]
MASDTNDYWFPAKRYGWGWGVPTRWQGWAVFLGYFALLGLAAWWIRPDRAPFAFFLATVGLSAVLALVCWFKGEPPRWRWGDKE